MTRRIRGRVRLIEVDASIRDTAQEAAARLTHRATNTAPACGDCGERPREDGSEFCRSCGWRLRARALAEEMGVPSPHAYDDERRGK